MKLSQKGTRALAAAVSTAKEFLQTNHKSVANGEEVEGDDVALDNEKGTRDIADWIGRTCKPFSSNKDEEAEVEEKDVGATQKSKKDNSNIDEYK